MTESDSLYPFGIEEDDVDDGTTPTAIRYRASRRLPYRRCSDAAEFFVIPGMLREQVYRVPECVRGPLFRSRRLPTVEYASTFDDGGGGSALQDAKRKPLTASRNRRD